MKANLTTENDVKTLEDGKAYRAEIVWAPIEEPSEGEKIACQNFRAGQSDRKDGLPCVSTNGRYLDGWYSPEQLTPPYVSEIQAKTYSL